MEKIKLLKFQRNSGIELLKLIAMLLIVISHVTQTLYTENPLFSVEYVVKVNYISKDIQHLILTWFSGFGAQGNIIFLVCSAWFLLDSQKINVKKIVYILLDVWILSIFFLVLFKNINICPIGFKDIIKSLFPTTFALNWYITCYLLLYAAHPFLNEIIYKRTQSELFNCTFIMTALYSGINYIHYGHFFTSGLIDFIVIYFQTAYIKLYLTKYSEKIKWNTIILSFALSATPILILVTDFLGFHISFFQDKLQHWGSNCSPFIFIVSICLFNIFRKIKFYSKIINYISSMSLLIYIIHENYFVREHLRPNIWIYIYEHYGYDNIVVVNLLISVCIFIISIIFSLIYKSVLQKYLHKFGNLLYNFGLKKYQRIMAYLFF